MAVLKTSHKSVRLYWPACPDTFSCSQHLINILGTSMGLCVLTLQRPKIFKIKHEDDPKYEWLEFMAWCRICQRRPRASNFFSMSTERHRTLHNLHSKQPWRQIGQKGSCALESPPGVEAWLKMYVLFTASSVCCISSLRWRQRGWGGGCPLSWPADEDWAWGKMPGSTQVCSPTPPSPLSPSIVTIIAIFTKNKTIRICSPWAKRAWASWAGSC